MTYIYSILYIIGIFYVNSCRHLPQHELVQWRPLLSCGEMNKISNNNITDQIHKICFKS